jgi:hypothetical protein
VTNYSSSSDAACRSQTPEEDREARRIEEEREAARKLDAFVAAHEGGKCSSKGATQPCESDELRTPDWTREQKLAAYTSRMDGPIHSDPLGNALIGIAVGGALGGIEAAAAGKTASVVVSHAAGHAGGHAALDAALHAAEDGAQHVGVWQAPSDAKSAGAGAAPTAPAAPAAGRSGTRAVSEPATEPNQSTTPPPPAGPDRVPYAPGKAPLVVPYAPVPIQG